MTSKPRLPLLRLIVSLAVSTTAIGLSGCVVAAAAVAAGTVAYIQGDLEATVAAAVPAVAQATDQTIKEMKFFEISNKQDAITAEFVMRNAQDDRITIRLTKSGDGLTKVQIRVGILGNEELSRAILEAIEEKL